MPFKSAQFVNSIACSGERISIILSFHEIGQKIFYAGFTITQRFIREFFKRKNNHFTEPFSNRLNVFNSRM